MSRDDYSKILLTEIAEACFDVTQLPKNLRLWFDEFKQGKTIGEAINTLSSEERIYIFNPKEEPIPKETIYVVQSSGSSLIKIGITMNLDERLRSIENATGSKISLLSFFKGSKKDEAKLHKMFNKYRRKGEWFEPSGELLNYVSNIPKQELINKNGEEETTD